MNLEENQLKKGTNEIILTEDIDKEQEKFLETTLGKTINTALDLGIRWALPDLIENEVISIKNTIFDQGLSAGVNKVINDAINIGKGIVGIATGKFENINQIEKVIDSGGLLNGISSLIDTTLTSAKKKGLINSNTTKLIKNSKNTIIKNISANIEDVLNTQVKSIDNLNKYMENWKIYYNNKNFDGMEKEYKKLKTNLEKIFPLEQTINDARNIEKIHILIKNKGEDFNLTQEELELLKKF